MSDIFDHHMDAYEDMISGRTYDEGYEGQGFNLFIYDPLHYHTKVTYTAIVAKTKLAFCLTIDGENIWIPKALIKERTKDSAYILTKFLIDKTKKGFGE